MEPEAQTFASVADAVKFAKSNVSHSELNRPGGEDRLSRGGKAPKGHGGAYVAVADGYNVKAVKAIKP
jgi:hypothetical protein